MRALWIALVLVTSPAIVVIIAGFIMGYPLISLAATGSILFTVLPFFVALVWAYRSTNRTPDVEQGDPQQH